MLRAAPVSQGSVSARERASVIRLELLTGNERRAGEVSLDELDAIIAEPRHLLWIDLEDPADRDFMLLQQEFGFHPLAIEDARRRHERPKLDIYEDYLFLVFYAARSSESDQLFTTQELSLFIGRNYLVTVHHEPCPEIDAIAERWRQQADQMAEAKQRVALLLYTLLDTVVDNYFPILDALAERTDRLEEAIFEGRDRGALEELFRLRKGLLALRRVVGPERDVLNLLTRRDIELLGPETAVYFQDVYDHILRVTDAIDTYRDLLASALDAYLSVVSNNLNQVMRTLTAWSIILMSLALIAGIYGMNFVNMPELRLSWGYYAALAGMAALGLGLFALFKRIDWL